MYNAEALMSYCEAFFIKNLQSLITGNDKFRKLLFNSRHAYLAHGILVTLGNKMEDMLRRRCNTPKTPVISRHRCSILEMQQEVQWMVQWIPYFLAQFTEVCQRRWREAECVMAICQELLAHHQDICYSLANCQRSLTYLHPLYHTLLKTHLL